MRLDRWPISDGGIVSCARLAFRGRSLLATIALGAVVASGCSDTTGPEEEPALPGPPGPVIGSIGVDLDDRTLSVSQTTQARAIVVDEKGIPLASESVVFGTSDDHVLTVSSTGLVTAMAPGTARVTARIGDHIGETGVFVRDAAEPGAIYARVRNNHVVRDSERYAFYEDSTFELTTSNDVDQESFSFPGWYSQAGTVIALDFFDNRRQWHATGTVRGDTLFVEYNLDMALSGFTDGAYFRTATDPEPSDDASPRLLIPDGQDPAWSPDGAKIAFTSTRDGEPTIYVARADGSGARRLAGGSWPAWSPDGRSIAFHREGLIGWGNGEVRVIDVDGSHERALVRGEFPAWSPDGTRIAFADEEGISAMRADGSGITRLLRGDFLPVTPSVPNGIGKPSWSPDGTRIAFEHVGDGDLTPAQIYVMSAAGSSPRRLTSTRGIQYAESDPAWSPDGTELAFWSYGFGIATTIHAGGGAVRTVHKDFPSVSYGARPSWSPDGTRIAFTVTDPEGGTAIWVVDSGQ